MRAAFNVIWFKVSPPGNDIQILVPLVRPDRSNRRESIENKNKRFSDSWIIVGKVMVDQFTVVNALFNAVVIRIHLVSPLYCCDYIIPCRFAFVNILFGFLQKFLKKKSAPISEGGNLILKSCVFYFPFPDTDTHPKTVDATSDDTENKPL